MTTILFTCPATRERVHHHIPDDDPLGPKEDAGFRCGECGRVHFVNRDGKVFRAEEAGRADKLATRRAVEGSQPWTTSAAVAMARATTPITVNPVKNLSTPFMAKTFGLCGIRRMSKIVLSSLKPMASERQSKDGVNHGPPVPTITNVGSVDRY